MRACISAIVKRETQLAFLQPGEVLQPVIFMLLVSLLFPLAIGPNPVVLHKVGAGVIWVVAILSVLLGLERLFRMDYEDGTLESYFLSPFPLWFICLLKVSTHWLFSFLPLLIVSPLIAVFFKLSLAMYQALLLTLLIGTPVMSFIGAIAVAVTTGLNRGGLLLGLLILPLFIPVLIFATSAINAAVLQLSYSTQLAWLGALLMLSLALSPYTIAYGLKVSQD